jgi:hypothetical protein
VESTRWMVSGPFSCCTESYFSRAKGISQDISLTELKLLQADAGSFSASSPIHA